MNEKEQYILCYIVIIVGLFLLVLSKPIEGEQKTITEVKESKENTPLKINATIIHILPGAKRTGITIKDQTGTITLQLRKKREISIGQEMQLSLKRKEPYWEVQEITPCTRPCGA